MTSEQVMEMPVNAINAAASENLHRAFSCTFVMSQLLLAVLKLSNNVNQAAYCCWRHAAFRRSQPFPVRTFIRLFVAVGGPPFTCQD